MNTQIKTENNLQTVQKAPEDSYLLKVNDTAVVIRFTGSDSLNTRLANAFNTMLN